MCALTDGSLVVISNRGPVGFHWEGDGWRTFPAAGGLASMLTPLVREAGLTWTCCVAEPAEANSWPGSLDAATAEVSGRLRAIPIPEPVFDGYYNGMSNETLWMLQHQLLGADGFAGVGCAQHRAWEMGYQPANRQVAEAVARSRPNARAFLIQDYHLYLVPALLRRMRPGVPILHFTHIPFPEPTVWHLLPKTWPATILKGMLGADVIGLQTGRDVDAFLASCHEFLGLPVKTQRDGARTAGTVLTDAGRRVLVRSYPASVDPASLAEEMRSPAVQDAREWLTRHAGGRLIVRADRLDPAKNQVAGFKAFGRLLETRPDLRGQLRFLAIMSPSRTDLSAYQTYRASVVSAADDINERFTEACGGPPIVLCLKNDRPLALAALERSDVLLANSLADGMNLVPKEWAIVAQHVGAAVISETAGVATEAADTALLVSPGDVERTALALGAALDMPRVERMRRLALFRERVTAWTSRDWLSAQLADLELPATAEATGTGPLSLRQCSVNAAISAQAVVNVT